MSSLSSRLDHRLGIERELGTAVGHPVVGRPAPSYVAPHRRRPYQVDVSAARRRRPRHVDICQLRLHLRPVFGPPLPAQIWSPPPAEIPASFEIPADVCQPCLHLRPAPDRAAITASRCRKPPRDPIAGRPPPPNSRVRDLEGIAAEQQGQRPRGQNSNFV
jgi:hypothetical protein